jgi:hypothetical protein
LLSDQFLAVILPLCVTELTPKFETLCVTNVVSIRSIRRGFDPYAHTTCLDTEPAHFPCVVTFVVV